jgi:hypothetical protein
VGKIMKISVDCDKGLFIGSFQPELWEIMCPFILNIDSFNLNKKKIGMGIGTTTRTFSLSSFGIDNSYSKKEIEDKIIIHLNRKLNLYQIQVIINLN